MSDGRPSSTCPFCGRGYYEPYLPTHVMWFHFDEQGTITIQEEP